MSKLMEIDDLQSQVEDHMREWELKSPRGEVIVEEEVAGLLDVVSTITNLRWQIEAIRQRELERLFNRLDLDQGEQELVANMTHRLVNKILHEPTLRLKREVATGNGVLYISTMRQLFGLTKSVHPIAHYTPAYLFGHRLFRKKKGDKDGTTNHKR